jgi:hypothetical protein
MEVEIQNKLARFKLHQLECGLPVSIALIGMGFVPFEISSSGKGLHLLEWGLPVHFVHYNGMVVKFQITSDKLFFE